MAEKTRRVTLADRRVIALGDRDGVPGSAIAACAAAAGATVVHTSTDIYVCAAAGAMDLELQRVLLRLATATRNPRSLLVLLGQADAIGVETYSLTLRRGDPGCSGVLTGRCLGLDVMHVLDPEFKSQVDPVVWSTHMGLFESLMEAETLVEAARFRSLSP